MQNCKINENAREISQKKYLTFSIITGICAGFINGLFGGGGGMVVVPLLMFLLKYPAKKAHATAIMIILPLSVLSALFYAAFATVRLPALASATAGVIGGGTLGALLLKNLSSKWVTIIFSLVMLAAGVKMLIF